MLQNLLRGQAVRGRLRVGDGQPRERLAGQIAMGIFKSSGGRTPERQLAPGVGEPGAGNASLLLLDQRWPSHVGGHEYVEGRAISDLRVEFTRGSEACGHGVPGYGFKMLRQFPGGVGKVGGGPETDLASNSPGDGEARQAQSQSQGTEQPEASRITHATSLQSQSMMA